MELPFQHLTVIGFGLIGGSIAMAAREMAPELWIQAVDPDEETLAYAVTYNIADKVSRVLPTSFAPNHLIVLASHLSINLELLRELAPRVVGQDVVVTDTGSCKRAVCELGVELLPTQFIGGHPMAGKEFSGVQQATSLLYAAKSYLLCPMANFPEASLRRVQRFVELLRAIPRSIDPETHDRYMAYVSHLPQLYSILLTNLLYTREPGRLLSYHGGGIDDQLRLAASPYPMWRDIFIQNQDNLRQVLNELSGLLKEADQALDTPAMADWFVRSNHLHREFHELRNF